MRSTNLLPIAVLGLLLMGSGCSEIEDPVFDYNLKSAKVIETNNNFGIQLLKEVVAHEEASNLMISPASVSLALGMAYNGARTTTQDAFEEVLNYERLTSEEINEISKELIHVLVTNSKGNQLEIANSVWYREGYPVVQDFLDLNTNYFDAEVREIDFTAADALKTINDWVSDKTHGKIDKILDQLDAQTAMILLNALYFNCLWEVEFDPDDTYTAPFFPADQPVIQTEMMTLKSTVQASFSDDFGAVELPYKNEKFSMYLFLPSPDLTVDDLVEQLDGDRWKAWLEGFSEQEDFTITMPKFKFEYKRSLANDLKSMGLEIAFTWEADFSGIGPSDLYIDDVIHKTYIDVNEAGTEAAAVTAIVFKDNAAEHSFLQLDRPFLFAITENSSNSIIFMGKVGEPSYE